MWPVRGMARAREGIPLPPSAFASCRSLVTSRPLARSPTTFDSALSDAAAALPLAALLRSSPAMTNATAAAGPLLSAAKTAVAFPIYHLAREEVLPGLADKYSSIFAPFATCARVPSLSFALARESHACGC